MIASHYALNPQVGRAEIGIERLAEIYDVVQAQQEPPPVVLDSDDLIEQPGAAVRAYCVAVGLPEMPHALSWQPGEHPQWQRARRWHDSAASSSGFLQLPQRYRDRVETSPVLAGYLAHHLPYYLKLRAARLSIGSEGAPGLVAALRASLRRYVCGHGRALVPAEPGIELPDGVPACRPGMPVGRLHHA